MNWFKKFWKALNEPTPTMSAPATTEVTIKNAHGEGSEDLSHFTPHAQQVLVLARKEAERLNHNFVGTEHVLLGLIKRQQGVAVNVLVKQGLNLETVRQEVEKQVGTGPGQRTIGSTPYTPRVKKAIALAQKEAKSLNHTHIGTEHILLGLLREGDGVAAKVLRNLDIELEKTRKEILKELDPNFDPGSTDAPKEPAKEAAASQPRFETPPTPPPEHETETEIMGNFTPRARQVLSLSRKEADRLNHNFLGTEHVLLGLIKLGSGVAVNVLKKQGLDLETVRQEVEKQVGKGSDLITIGNIPYTPRVRKVLALANEERRKLYHTYLGTEHLLLGLLREGAGAAAKVLRALDVDVEQTRKEILQELDPNFSSNRTAESDASTPEEPAAEQPQTESLHERLFKFIKPESVDLTKRYDVYCIEHGQSVVYRNVLFKGVKGLLPNREYDLSSQYIELGLMDGKSVFLPKHSVFKFCDPGASADGEKVPPPKN